MEKIAQEKKEEQEKAERLERLKQAEDRRKEEFGKEIASEEAWWKHGKSDVPCLFDSKCAYLGELSSLPLSLEHQISRN